MIAEILKIEESLKKEMPNPSEEDLQSKDFESVWQAIKNWDINVPDYYDGYCGANGSHAMLILNSIRQSE